MYAGEIVPAVAPGAGPLPHGLGVALSLLGPGRQEPALSGQPAEGGLQFRLHEGEWRNGQASGLGASTSVAASERGARGDSATTFFGQLHDGSPHGLGFFRGGAVGSMGGGAGQRHDWRWSDPGNSSRPLKGWRAWHRLTPGDWRMGRRDSQRIEGIADALRAAMSKAQRLYGQLRRQLLGLPASANDTDCERAEERRKRFGLPMTASDHDCRRLRRKRLGLPMTASDRDCERTEVCHSLFCHLHGDIALHDH